MSLADLLPWRCKACGHRNNARNSACVFCRVGKGEH